MQSVLAYRSSTGNGDDAVAAKGVHASAPSLHSMLRQATRAPHARLDDALSRFDLADATDYRLFLEVHRRALTALSQHCGPRDRLEIDSLIDLLHTDLRIDVAAPFVESEGCATNEACQTGVAYVLRGSRLGAAFLQRRVAAHLPVAYLRHGLAESWPDFLSRLDTIGTSLDADSVIAAAWMAFSVFIDASDAVASDRPDSAAASPMRSNHVHL